MRETEDKIKELAKKIETMKSSTSPKETMQSAALGAQAVRICIDLISGVIVGSSIGYILDEVFDFRFIFLLIFTIFGGAAGILNVVRYINRNQEHKEEN